MSLHPDDQDANIEVTTASISLRPDDETFMLPLHRFLCIWTAKMLTSMLPGRSCCFLLELLPFSRSCSRNARMMLPATQEYAVGDALCSCKMSSGAEGILTTTAALSKTTFFGLGK